MFLYSCSSVLERRCWGDLVEVDRVFLANLFAVFVESPDGTAHDESDKGEEGVAPAESERVVHRATSEGEESAEERTGAGKGGEGRGSVLREGINPGNN